MTYLLTCQFSRVVKCYINWQPWAATFRPAGRRGRFHFGLTQPLRAWRPPADYVGPGFRTKFVRSSTMRDPVAVHESIYFLCLSSFTEACILKDIVSSNSFGFHRLLRFQQHITSSQSVRLELWPSPERILSFWVDLTAACPLHITFSNMSSLRLQTRRHSKLF